MRNHNRKYVEAVAEVNELIDLVYGPYIEKTVAETNQPELRVTLKELFFKYLLLEHSIKNTKHVEEFESQIEESSQLLKQRIGEAQKRIAYLTEIKKAELRAQRATMTKQFYAASLDLLDNEEKETADSEDEPEMQEFRRIKKNVEEISSKTFRKGEELWEGLERFQTILDSIDQHQLQEGLDKFIKWRKIRRAKQFWLRLFWNVILFGYIFSLLVSRFTKLLPLRSLLILAVVGISVALLKEFKIGPWLRQRRMESQRADLLLSLRDFMVADLKFAILAPLKEGHQRETASKTVGTMVQEIKKEFSATA